MARALSRGTASEVEYKRELARDLGKSYDYVNRFFSSGSSGRQVPQAVATAIRDMVRTNGGDLGPPGRVADTIEQAVHRAGDGVWVGGEARTKATNHGGTLRFGTREEAFAMASDWRRDGREGRALKRYRIYYDPSSGEWLVDYDVADPYP